MGNVWNVCNEEVFARALDPYENVNIYFEQHKVPLAWFVTIQPN